jgi:hypothetical protein
MKFFIGADKNLPEPAEKSESAEILFVADQLICS